MSFPANSLPPTSSEWFFIGITFLFAVAWNLGAWFLLPKLSANWQDIHNLVWGCVGIMAMTVIMIWRFS